jgi:hypothetical protein
MNPPTAHYEFLGPPGALAVSLLVPATTYALFFACNEQNACIPALASDRVVAALSDPDWWLALWDPQAALIYLGWYVFCILVWAILPGDWVKGTTLRNGGHQSYKINGTTFLFSSSFLSLLLCFQAFSTFLLALGIASGIIFNFGPQSFTILYEKWVGFLTASILMATVQAVYCYAFSFRSGALLALGGNSGNPIYDVCSPLASHFRSSHRNVVVHRTGAQPLHWLS